MKFIYISYISYTCSLKVIVYSNSSTTAFWLMSHMRSGVWCFTCGIMSHPKWFWYWSILDLGLKIIYSYSLSASFQHFLLLISMKSFFIHYWILPLTYLFLKSIYFVMQYLAYLETTNSQCFSLLSSILPFKQYYLQMIIFLQTIVLLLVFYSRLIIIINF